MDHCSSGGKRVCDAHCIIIFNLFVYLYVANMLLIKLPKVTPQRTVGLLALCWNFLKGLAVL